VVFFGRFVTVLRAWAASLSGTNQMRWSRFLFFLRTHQHRLEAEAGRALPGSLDDYRKAPREEKLSRASQFLSQTPRHTERSQLQLDELIGEAQAMAPVDGTFEHMGQAFAAREPFSQENRLS